MFLMLVSLIGLWQSYGWRAALLWAWMPVLILLVGFFGLGGGIKATTGQIFETESQYNYIQVLEEDGYRYLRLNEGQGIHSAYHPTEINYYGPWKQSLETISGGTFLQ
jgi:hypothetical protein